MPTFLQAMAAVKAARELHDAAQKAAKADPSNLTKSAAAKGAAAGLTAAYVAAIAAAEGQSALVKQRDELLEAKVIHHEKYEKKTVETEDKPPETTPSQESSPSSSAPASEEEEEEEEEEKGKKAGAPPKPPMREKKGKRGESEEEEEEKAIAGAYQRASSSYRKAMVGQGVDAYGAKYGPEALLRACMKALGTGSIAETFGALSELPAKLNASATIAADVEALKKRDRAARVSQMIDAAKASGVPMTAKRRADLQALGAEHGTKHLKGVLAMMPRLPTGAIDPAENGNDGRGIAQGGDAQAEAAIEQAAAAFPKGEEREKFKALMRANLRAQMTKVPAV